MTKPSTRTIGITLCVVSLALLIPSVFALASRLEGRLVPIVWFLDPILDYDFAYRGDPLHVQDTTLTNDDGTERPAVTVTYRGRDTLIPIETMDDRLPILQKYEYWMTILPMAEGGNARSADEIEQRITAGTIKPRLIIATRHTPEEYDSGSWGLVRRKDWIYRFYEFIHDVPVEESVSITSGTYRELEKLVDPDERAKDNREGDLWMYHAMIRVTPPNYFPKNKQVDESIAAMGWAWPIARFSILGIVGGVMLILMSTIRTPDPD